MENLCTILLVAKMRKYGSYDIKQTAYNVTKLSRSVKITRLKVHNFSMKIDNKHIQLSPVITNPNFEAKNV